MIGYDPLISRPPPKSRRRWKFSLIFLTEKLSTLQTYNRANLEFQGKCCIKKLTTLGLTFPPDSGSSRRGSHNIISHIHVITMNCLKTILILTTLILGSCKPGTNSNEKPNFIIIFVDDLGYQDLGCFGSPNIRTPRIDKMAVEGMRLTNFYVAAPVCGPSRAALMTGCYPLRVAQHDNLMRMHPAMHQDEVTIAEVLKSIGYSTAAFGKWDLAGHSQDNYVPELLPTHQGFDEFFGTPTSNDLKVNILRNEEMIEENADMANLTERYTDACIDFIRKNKDEPFFAYVAHTMPHTELGATEKFKGKSERGLYGDVVEEIDWNTGRILDVVNDLGLDEKTYVIFTSDNGPWWIKNEEGGTALPLRGAKTSTWEGGMRVPCVVRAPGKVPAGRISDELITTMDLFPSFAALSGAQLPNDRRLDGHNVTDLLLGKEDVKSPTKAFFYYNYSDLQAVRSGKWKLFLEYDPSPRIDFLLEHISPDDRVNFDEFRLYNLEEDISETTNVAGQYPEIVAELLDLAEWAKKDIGHKDIVGVNARAFDPGERHYPE